jgi:hypothetical protein
MPDPQPQAPHQPSSAPEPAHGRRLIQSGRLRWLHRLPLALFRHATVSTVPRFQGQGRPPGQAAEKGQDHDRGQRQLRRQPHRRPRAAAHRERDRPGQVPGGGVGSAGAGAVVLHRDRVAATRPSTPGSRCPRAAESWSWADSSNGAGPLRTAAPARPSRSSPRSWGRACGGRRRPRPGRRGTRTTSQLDQRSGGAGRGRSMLAFRSVVSVLLRALGDFSLRTQGRPAGGRLRRPSSRRQRHDRP